MNPFQMCEAPTFLMADQLWFHIAQISELEIYYDILWQVPMVVYATTTKELIWAENNWFIVQTANC